MDNETTGNNNNTAWIHQGSSALCFSYLYVIKHLITHSVLTEGMKSRAALSKGSSAQVTHLDKA